MTRLTPYLHYAGDCAEAFRFYERALGGRINMMSTYGEAPADSHPPIVYPVALTAASKNPDARAFYDFLISDAAKPAFVKQGFTIVAPAS